LDEAISPKSLRRVLNQEDRCHQPRLQSCGSWLSGETTWISPELQAIYWELYRTGWAYSLKLGRATNWLGNFIVLGSLYWGIDVLRIAEGSKAMVKLWKDCASAISPSTPK